MVGFVVKVYRTLSYRGEPLETPEENFISYDPDFDPGFDLGLAPFPNNESFDSLGIFDSIEDAKTAFNTLIERGHFKLERCDLRTAKICKLEVVEIEALGKSYEGNEV